MIGRQTFIPSPSVTAARWGRVTMETEPYMCVHMCVCLLENGTSLSVCRLSVEECLFGWKWAQLCDVVQETQDVYWTEPCLCILCTVYCMTVWQACWGMTPSESAVCMNLTLGSPWRGSVSTHVSAFVSCVLARFRYVDWAVCGFPPVWEESRMSLRKRLSFKRVWNFNTVSSRHTHTLYKRQSTRFFSQSTRKWMKGNTYVVILWC